MGFFSMNHPAIGGTPILGNSNIGYVEDNLHKTSSSAKVAETQGRRASVPLPVGKSTGVYGCIYAWISPRGK